MNHDRVFQGLGALSSFGREITLNRPLRAAS
jgi:hypothetical protein